MGQKRGTADKRGQLIYEFHECVDAIRPAFFLMENVPDLATRNGSETLEKLITSFERSGYTVTWKVLNSANYGAPTKRKRIFVVGFLNGTRFSFPPETHAQVTGGLDLGLRPWVTSSQAFAGLPEPTRTAPFRPQAHQAITHTIEVRQRFASISPGGYDYTRKRARLHPNAPSPSLVAGNLKGIRWAIHPTKNRELTNREAARIHGFPDWFEFAGSHAAIGVQVANAVPIPLGEAVATAIAQHLDTEANPALYTMSKLAPEKGGNRERS
jgi:DNA (cytosine-5)-methyltransferase 1